MNALRTFGVATPVAMLISSHAEGGKHRAVRHLAPVRSEPVIVRISTPAAGGEANGPSEWAATSADGRFTAFASTATLVDADSDRGYDIYLYDRIARTIALVTPPEVVEPVRPSISGDRMMVAYAGGIAYLRNVYIYDRASAKTTNISALRQGVSSDQVPRLSGSGEIVAFESLDGGSFIIRTHDRSTGITVAHANLGFAITPTLTSDGNLVACVSALFGGADIRVLDRLSGRVERSSVANSGAPGNGNSTRSTISADGRFVAFDSAATNLVDGDTNGAKHDVFVHDRLTRTTRAVSVAPDGTRGDGNSYRPSLSAHGRYVAFQSDATNLVTGDTNGKFDIFSHDRLTGMTRRVSVAADGTQGNDHSPQFREDPVGPGPSLSADGRFVVFRSEADNLVPGDTNRAADIFLVATGLTADE